MRESIVGQFDLWMDLVDNDLRSFGRGTFTTKAFFQGGIIPGKFSTAVFVVKQLLQLLPKHFVGKIPLNDLAQNRLIHDEIDQGDVRHTDHLPGDELGKLVGLVAYGLGNPKQGSFKRGCAGSHQRSIRIRK